jgi:hypothetical protein
MSLARLGPALQLDHPAYQLVAPGGAKFFDQLIDALQAR